MEKQVNKLKMNKYKFFIASVLFYALTSWSWGQESKFYVIDSIAFEGLSLYNPQTVKSFLGIKKGDLIEVPGTAVSDMVRKLWMSKEFEDIQVFVEPVSEGKAILIFKLKESPQLSKVLIKGVSKSRAKSFIEDLKLNKGKIYVNQDLLKRIERHIKNYYIKKGFLNTRVTHHIIKDTVPGKVLVVSNVKKGKRVKILDINFHGNKAFKKGRLLRKLKKTKRINPLRFWKSSKYIEEEFNNDLQNLVEFYHSKGYRNARIVKDSVYKAGEDLLAIDIYLNEGKKYYFGDIKFVGNSVYPERQLAKILGIKKGDPYNGKLLKERIQNPKKPDGIDLTNLYQNNGYLFSRITPVEVGIRGDSIDFEIRIYEGKIAYFNNITIKGNDRTKDYVILRELRTLPGEKYNKELVVRTVRELAQLQLFNAENIEPKFKNVDPVNGLVDIEWNVEEGGVSQIQLQGGYGGGTFMGTLMLSLNNFALGDVFKKKAWTPVPMGEGQRLSISANMSFLFKSYSISFMEPWLGGKKPQSLSISAYSSVTYQPKEGSTYYALNPDYNKKFKILGLGLGLGKRLSWPDDFFSISHSLSYQHYKLQNYAGYYGITALFGFSTGTSNNLNYTLTLGRKSSGPNPIFPLGGSDFVFSAQLTPPYSLFNNVNYKYLEQHPDYQDENGNPDYAKINQEKYRWLEFYKLKFSGTWYTRIYDKLVLRSKTEFGLMGAYNHDLGIPPFERFYVGGDGLQQGYFDSRDIIPLRGYNANDLNREALTGAVRGGVVYNKFSLELRYPLTLKPQASIWVLGFAEGANTYSDVKIYNPFQLKRSAGLGMRVFMSMFGLLGVDFGYGFDPVYINGVPRKQGWRTSFIINQQL